MVVVRHDPHPREPRLAHAPQTAGELRHERVGAPQAHQPLDQVGELALTPTGHGEGVVAAAVAAQGGDPQERQHHEDAREGGGDPGELALPVRDGERFGRAHHHRAGVVRDRLECREPRPLVVDVVEPFQLARRVPEAGEDVRLEERPPHELRAFRRVQEHLTRTIEDRDVGAGRQPQPLVKGAHDLERHGRARGADDVAPAVAQRPHQVDHRLRLLAEARARADDEVLAARERALGRRPGGEFVQPRRGGERGAVGGGDEPEGAGRRGQRPLVRERGRQAGVGIGIGVGESGEVQGGERGLDVDEGVAPLRAEAARVGIDDRRVAVEPPRVAAAQRQPLQRRGHRRADEAERESDVAGVERAQGAIARAAKHLRASPQLRPVSGASGITSARPVQPTRR